MHASQSPPFRKVAQLLAFLLGPTPNAIARRHIAADGRKQYFRQAFDESMRQGYIHDHLNSARQFASYIGFKEDGQWVTQSVIFDIDVARVGHPTGMTSNQAAHQLALSVFHTLENIGLWPFLERSQSGNGYHVTLVFDDTIAHADAFEFGQLIARGLDIEHFPKQAKPKTFGNCVALPCGFQTASAIWDPDQQQWGNSTEHIRLSSAEAICHYILTHPQEPAPALLAAPQRGTKRGKSETLPPITCEAVMRLTAPERITEENGDVLFCDCPVHRSESKRSLHIDIAGDKWFCFGCGYGGRSWHLANWLLGGEASNHDIWSTMKGIADAV